MLYPLSLTKSMRWLHACGKAVLANCAAESQQVALGDWLVGA